MKYLKLILLVLTFTMIFSACDADSQAPTQTTDVCVLVGDFSNAKDADLSIIGERVDPTINANVKFTIYVLDGVPDDVVLTSEYENGNRNSADIIRNHYNKFLKNDLIPKINSAVPNQEETNILNGLCMAEKHLSKSDADFKKLFIFSTGIPTSGYINFASDSSPLNLNDKELNLLLKEFEEKNYLPDLSGIEVQWFNMCETISPQNTPDRANRVKIESLWTEVLKKCGVEEANIKFDYSTLDSTDSEEKVNYPFVTPVVFEDESIIVSFTDEVVRFNPGKATFLDEKLVYRTLKPYAEKICETVSKKFIIVGSTATYGNKDECLELSLERAEAVKKVLCDYGVSESILFTYGVGQNEVGDNLTERVSDVVNGKFIEEYGKLNRKVMVVDTSTNLGKQLLEELKVKE